MTRRLGVSIAIGLLLALGTIFLWSSLKSSYEEQVARSTEAESYAARSQLVRKVDTMLSALEKVRGYWSKFGRLPKDQWATDVGVELDHFDGIEMVVWDDPANGIRYARTDENPRFDHVPGDEEWESYVQLVKRARESTDSHILGPFESASGMQSFEIVFAGTNQGETDVLVALVNIQAMMEGLLQEESPGFAVTVIVEDGTVIYQRGEPARGLPESWIRSGRIRSSFGSLWEVVHTPSEELIGSSASPAIDLTLLLGLIISVLVATLVFENSRARSRADAAEIAEEQVSDLNRDLEQQVAERTEELSQRTADLETFTESVAHDLRNPLNAINVNAQLLEVGYGDKLGADAQAVVARISPNVRQITRILDRLLGLSKFASTTFSREHIDMQQLVMDTFEQLLAAEPEQAPQVSLDVRDLPSVNADRNMVHILLVNLLGNAIKYTSDRDSARITVAARVHGDETIYSVQDNGIGFEASQAEQVFTAFVRLGSESEKKGLGLGLMLAKKVVKRHGGRIWAEGVPDEGATFYFTLQAAASV